MKLISTLIRPNRLDSVKAGLNQAHIYSFNVAKIIESNIGRGDRSQSHCRFGVWREIAQHAVRKTVVRDPV